jgi:hypothetical protein
MSEASGEIPVPVQKSNKIPGQKPKEVWNFFIPVGERREGHQGCKCKYCPWT